MTTLRDLAAAATPGEWVALPDGVYVGAEWTDEGWLTYDALVVELEDDFGEPHPDAEWIAAANPAVITALLDRTEAAEAKVATLRDMAPYLRKRWWVRGSNEAAIDVIRAALRDQS